jgi:hypothetical protein
MKESQFVQDIRVALDDMLSAYANNKYPSWHAPNTTFKMADDTPERLIHLSHPAIQLYLRCISLLKRNYRKVDDPVLACTIILRFADVEDVMGRTSFKKARTQLVHAGLIVLDTKRQSALVFVKPTFASKLSAPNTAKK